MVLIKSGFGALGGTLADQWKRFFYCESIGKEVMVTKDKKQLGVSPTQEKMTISLQLFYHCAWTAHDYCRAVQDCRGLCKTRLIRRNSVRDTKPLLMMAI